MTAGAEKDGPGKSGFKYQWDTFRYTQEGAMVAFPTWNIKQYPDGRDFVVLRLESAERYLQEKFKIPTRFSPTGVEIVQAEYFFSEQGKSHIPDRLILTQ